MYGTVNQGKRGRAERQIGRPHSSDHNMKGTVEQTTKRIIRKSMNIVQGE